MKSAVLLLTVLLFLLLVWSQYEQSRPPHEVGHAHLGILEPSKELQPVRNPSSLWSSTPLPGYFKYKEKYLTPVRDQGGCASCWAFAVTDVLADRLSIYTGGRIKESLSVQELVSCYRPFTFLCELGGVPEDAYKYLSVHGVLTEKAYPYVQSKTKGIHPCYIGDPLLMGVGADLSPVVVSRNLTDRVYAEMWSSKSLCEKIVDGDTSTRSRNIQNMKSDIYYNGPICGTLLVHDDFYRYDGRSVYRKSPNARPVGGHAIEIHGWCEAGENTKEPGFEGAYWICKNSWGLKWPKKINKWHGWFYVEMGSNMCGIEARASSCLPFLTKKAKEYNKGVDRKTVAYTSYQEYVQDPERLNFYGP